MHRLALCLLALLSAGSAGAQEFPALRWQADSRVPKARQAFVAAVDPDIAFVAAEAGLYRTADNGATWALLPGTEPAAMGTIADIKVCPARPGLVLLGSLGKGVFISRDGGGTWSPASGTGAGLLHTSVCAVAFGLEDSRAGTFWAAHGTAGLGLSKSIDAGRTWRGISPSRHFHCLQMIREPTADFLYHRFVGSSSPPDDPQARCVVSSVNYGESWHKVSQPGWSPTAGAVLDTMKDGTVWGAQGGQVCLIESYGKELWPVRNLQAGDWESVFTTTGSKPGGEWVWVYEPRGQGLACGYFEPRNRMQKWQRQNRGLFVNNAIKSGAMAAANRTGTRFYACVNSTLFTAQREAPPAGPVIRQARAEPPVIAFSYSALHRLLPLVKPGRWDGFYRTAAATNDPRHAEFRRLADLEKEKLRFAVQVQVEHPQGAGAIKSVTVDPRPLGPPGVPLYDDGRHGDRAAGDGFWSGTVAMDAAAAPALPGIHTFGVTAADAAGKTDSWTAQVGLYHTPAARIDFWNAHSEWARDPKAIPVEGGVSVLASNTPLGTELRFEAGRAPWKATLARRRGDLNGTDFPYVAFRFKGSPGAGDVRFFLVDSLYRGIWDDTTTLEPNTESAALPLLKGKYLPAMDGRFHSVRIPILDLVQGRRFMRHFIAGFGLAADPGSAPGSYILDDVHFLEE